MMKMLLSALIAGCCSAQVQVPRFRCTDLQGARHAANTLRPEYAIAQGVDAIELDMAVTRTTIVVSHDPFCNRRCAAGQPASPWYDAGQVRQWDCGAVRNPQFPRQQLAPGTRARADEVFVAPRAAFFNIETKIFAQQPELTPPPEEFAGWCWR
jgi:glycerophosphoryl diester phosphodiesterase